MANFSLVDLLKRKLLGEATMQPYGFEPAQTTQGLFGQGGQIGGGLLQTRMNQPGGLLGGNIPELALLGSALYGQGMQGKDPLEGLFPAYTQAAQLKAALTPEKEKLITAYDPKTKKRVFATRTEIEKKGLEPVPESPELTADQRNFAAFKNIMETGSDFEKKLAPTIFTKGGRDIKSKEEFLIGISSELAKDAGNTPESISAILPQYAGIYDKVIGNIDTPLQAPKNFDGTNQEWKILKDANPNLSDEVIIENWKKYKKG